MLANPICRPIQSSLNRTPKRVAATLGRSRISGDQRVARPSVGVVLATRGDPSLLTHGHLGRILRSLSDNGCVVRAHGPPVAS